MQPEILVTGAPGNVGSEVVKRLKVPCRVAAYSPESAREAFSDQENVQIVQFDFQDPATYGAAFQGIKRLFLVRPPALSNIKRDIAPAIEAAVAAGVQHIVFLSIQGVEDNRIVPHYKIEQAIKALDVGYTFLRAGFFMQNLSTTHRAEIRDEGEIALPVGNARTSFIDVRDIAAVAAHFLTTPAPDSSIHTLTGGQALTYDEVAAIMSDVLEEPVEYKHLSPFRFFFRQVKSGSSIGYAFVVTALYTITRMGNAETVTDDVEQVLGRPPVSFKQFVRDYQTCWQVK